MAENAGAVAVVNCDFFNNDENAHPDAPHTNAPVGPVIMGGQDIKAAVPDKQRMGPARDDLVYPGSPDFPANQTVLGITTAGEATITELSLDGSLQTRSGEFTLDGLNQYAIPEGGIGAFTSEWGTGPRLRAICGDEGARNGPCSDSILEITVADDIVTEATVIDECCEASSDPVDAGEVVFVARDAAADELADVAVGDPLYWDHDLVAPDGAEFTTAIGGYPLVIDGRGLPGVDPGDRRPRTIAGHDKDGTTLFLAVVEEATLTEGSWRIRTLHR
ncbi:phosphodiester glycosidase family protein [Glycomyces buryatensis]|uniref:Phosphodiester glycosidase family protein n=1 Tax=Glycomyces buryatensis TaxID=2570927 RepID=A0A4S8QMT3_9ACTN|nr:phosphodiester glycosidase family protein [Glycomyces buryatensis]THV42749.1 phosphodiester glycosidase family protein [Glycomyces buryatensis]